MQPHEPGADARLGPVRQAQASPETTDLAVYLSSEADRIWAHLRARGNAYTVAVFVAPDGVFFAAPSGRRAYRSLVAKYERYEIGHYNRRVDLSDLRDDLFFAACQVW